MVRILAVYQRRLQCEVVHEPSQTRLLTDAPKDNMGNGASFSPTDLTATSLLTCMLTTMGIVAQKGGFEFGRASGEVIKEMSPAPDRKIARLTVLIRMPQGLSSEQKALMERTALTCPVFKSLSPGIEIPVRFEYPA